LEDFELDPEKPLVLLLGGVTHEGIVSALSAAGRQYKQKYPESQVRNWHSILRYFDTFEVREVIWKLTPSTYEILARRAYEEVRECLLERIAAVPHVLFVHEDVVSGKADSEWSMEFYQPPEEVRDKVNALFDEYQLRVMPYSRNAELTVMAAEFIADTEQGLLLRVYVPSGRMWSQETDKLLQLFRDYLGRVSKLSVRLDQARTDRGIIYEFHGDEGAPSRDLTAEFNEFSAFMDFCVSDPEQASRLLADRSVPQREVAEILTRYSKEARRLQVDLKQDREMKLLGIRHRLESELVDTIANPESALAVEALVDAAVPRVLGIGAAAMVDQAPLQLATGNAVPGVSVNFKPQIVQAIGGIVAQEIRGDVRLTQQDQQLLELIQKHGGAKSAELASAVHELADPSAPKPGRIVAKSKLKKFLLRIGSRLEGVAAGMLQSYIEGKLGI